MRQIVYSSVRWSHCGGKTLQARGIVWRDDRMHLAHKKKHGGFEGTEINSGIGGLATANSFTVICVRCFSVY